MQCPKCKSDRIKVSQFIGVIVIECEECHYTEKRFNAGFFGDLLGGMLF